jgi:hypothetical protein
MSDSEPQPPIQRRSCGVMSEFHRLLERDPEYRNRLVKIEETTQRSIARMNVAKLAAVTVPIVVHVVHKKAAHNISDAQIHSQIDILNADYSAINTDLPNVPSPWTGLVGNARVKFKLASIDTSGQPASGIVRRKTTIDGFGQNDAVKSHADGGSDGWDSERYLNIWVCDLQDGLLGYAQFPGGPAATDGVVIRNTAFGTIGIAAVPFNLGRTTTHEVGHYLNLRHIWGDTEDCSGSDLVSDTPRQQLPNYNEPSFPHLSCNNGPHGDMFVNYMDYVDDRAMFMFTAGQVARMRATLSGPRKNLIKDAGSRT